ncbi:hypothetical protein [Parvibaculum sedimenti]|uniref:hypothetical protein n=1 Tax=Parvibaculum sedimenti TaxID=2608632 RepID=UPI00163A6D4C|nr:hypothetical protein [Parvibaculum sedimenti]
MTGVFFAGENPALHFLAGAVKFYYFIFRCSNRVEKIVVQIHIVYVVDFWRATKNLWHIAAIEANSLRLNAAENLSSLYAEPGGVEIVKLESLAVVNEIKTTSIWRRYENLVK